MKTIIFTIIFPVILAILLSIALVKIVGDIEKEIKGTGLKNIVNEIWEGTNTRENKQ